MQTSLAGAGSTKIWSGTDAPNAVAVDGAYVYVLQNTDVERVPIGGGAAQQLSNVGGAYGLTVTATTVLWTSYNLQDTVLAVPVGGGAVSTFATGTWPSASSTVAVQDGTTLVWGDTTSGAASGAVYAKPLAGGAQTTLFSGAIEPLGIAVDTSFLYVTTGQAGTVLRIQKDNGSVTTLATGQGWPYGIAVDNAFVYWVNNSGGANAVMRIAKNSSGVAPDGGAPDAAPDGAAKPLCTDSASCTQGSACYESGPTACGALAPGYCLWMLTSCLGGTWGTPTGLHFPKDIGDPGSISAPPCSSASCDGMTVGSTCSSTTDPLGDPIESPCFNGGADAYRQSTGVGYYECTLVTGVDIRWTFLGSTYTACMP
jgi:hypothetical protein